MRVQGSGFRVGGRGLGVERGAWRAEDSGWRVIEGQGSRVYGSGFGV